MIFDKNDKGLIPKGVRIYDTKDGLKLTNVLKEILKETLRPETKPKPDTQQPLR